VSYKIESWIDTNQISKKLADLCILLWHY